MSHARADGNAPAVGLSRLGAMSAEPAVQTSATGAVLALKEWAAAAHALLDGRQTLLLRKGGIGEKRFEVERDRFVLFPTVAHSHAERVRPEHADLLARGAADVDGQSGTFVVRCGVVIHDVVPVARPEALDQLLDLHIWTPASVLADRVRFRPKVPLQVLVVRAVALPEPVTLQRLPGYGGCTSWVNLPLAWDGASGRQIHDAARLDADAARVRAAVA